MKFELHFLYIYLYMRKIQFHWKRVSNGWHFLLVSEVLWHPRQTGERASCMLQHVDRCMGRWQWEVWRQRRHLTGPKKRKEGVYRRQEGEGLPWDLQFICNASIAPSLLTDQAEAASSCRWCLVGQSVTTERKLFCILLAQRQRRWLKSGEMVESPHSLIDYSTHTHTHREAG